MFNLVVILLVAKFSKHNCQEAQLFWTLFHDYNANVRPVTNKSSPITVWVEYYLFTIVYINEREHTMSIVGVITMKWMDFFLKWNKSEYHNISSIVAKAQDVWVPDISVRNGVERLSVVDHKSPQKLIIKSNGEISFDLVREIRVFCHLDFTYFPFDLQTCQIYIDSWTYTTEWVVFKAAVDKINLIHQSAHEQWRILDTEVKLNERVYPEIESNFSEIIFIIHLKRYPLFHFTYFIYPCVVTFVVAQLVFLVPSGTRKKIGFSITVLLSFTVFLDTMFYVLPEIGDYVPYITVYVVFVMFMSSLFLFTTIIILILHHHCEDEQPPNWLQYVVLNKLATIIRMSNKTTWVPQKIHSLKFKNGNFEHLRFLYINIQKSINVIQDRIARERVIRSRDSDYLKQEHNANNKTMNRLLETLKYLNSFSVDSENSVIYPDSQTHNFENYFRKRKSQTTILNEKFNQLNPQNQQNLQIKPKIQQFKKANPSEDLRIIMNDLAALVRLVPLLAKINETLNTELDLLINMSLWIEISNVINRFLLYIFFIFSTFGGLWLLWFLPDSKPDELVDPVMF